MENIQHTSDGSTIDGESSSISEFANLKNDREVKRIKEQGVIGSLYRIARILNGENIGKEDLPVEKGDQRHIAFQKKYLISMREEYVGASLSLIPKERSKDKCDPAFLVNITEIIIEKNEEGEERLLVVYKPNGEEIIKDITSLGIDYELQGEHTVRDTHF